MSDNKIKENMDAEQAKEKLSGLTREGLSSVDIIDSFIEISEDRMNIQKKIDAEFEAIQRQVQRHLEPEPVVEPEVETVVEPERVVEPEPVVEAAAPVVEEPVIEAAPEPTPETVVEPEPEVERAPEPTPEPEVVKTLPDDFFADLDSKFRGIDSEAASTKAMIDQMLAGLGGGAIAGAAAAQPETAEPKAAAQPETAELQPAAQPDAAEPVIETLDEQVEGEQAKVETAKELNEDKATTQSGYQLTAAASATAASIAALSKALYGNKERTFDLSETDETLARIAESEDRDGETRASAEAGVSAEASTNVGSEEVNKSTAGEGVSSDNVEKANPNQGAEEDGNEESAPLGVVRTILYTIITIALLIAAILSVGLTVAKDTGFGRAVKSGVDKVQAVFKDDAEPEGEAADAENADAAAEAADPNAAPAEGDAANAADPNAAPTEGDAANAADPNAAPAEGDAANAADPNAAPAEGDAANAADPNAASAVGGADVVSGAAGGAAQAGDAANSNASNAAPAGDAANTNAANAANAAATDAVSVDATDSVMGKAIKAQSGKAKNILAISEDAELKFPAYKITGAEGVDKAIAFDNDLWYTSNNSENKHYSTEIVGFAIDYYSKLMERMNKGDEEVLKLIAKDTKLMTDVSAIKSDHLVIHTISKMQIGEMRKNGDDLYLILTITETTGDEKPDSTYTKVMHFNTADHDLKVKEIGDATKQ